MEHKLQKINVKQLPDNVFKILEDDWMLITAGNLTSFNTMTASWGTLGVLWNRPIVICFIRPQRYTLEFVEKEDYFTLSFFPEKYHDALSFCGSYSGRTVNKVNQTGLTPIVSEHGSVYFSQARLMIECRKLYTGKFDKNNFIATNLIREIYPKSDFHHFFIGEITSCLSDVVLIEKGKKFENLDE